MSITPVEIGANVDAYGASGKKKVYEGPERHEAQNALARKVTEEAKAKLDELDTNLPFRVVKKGDTLGALALGFLKAEGYEGRLDYNLPVDYRSDKVAEDDKPTKLSDKNARTYPGQFVWLERNADGTYLLVIDDNKPETEENETSDEENPNTPAANLNTSA